MLSDNPGALAALLNAASQNYGAGHYATAAEGYLRVLQVDNNNAVAHFRLGQIAHRQNRLGAALASINMALASAPNQPAFHYTQGLVLHDMRQLDQAAASFRRAIDLKPDLVQAWNNLGIVLQDEGKPAEAEAAFRRVLDFDPGSANALNNLGTVLRELNRPEEAKECMLQAIRLKPDFQSAHYNLGSTLLALADFRQAADCLKAAVSLRPAHIEAWLALSKALDETQDMEGAASCYAQVLQLKPDHRGALLALGELLARHNRTQEARRYYARAADQGDLLARIAARLILPIVYRDNQELVAARDAYAEGLQVLSAEADAVVDVEEIVRGVQWTNFYLAYQGRDDRSLQESYGRMVSGLMSRAVPELMGPLAPSAEGKDKVRVGFVSKYFKLCTAGNYFKSWVTQLDRSCFESHVYYLDYPEDKVTQEIRRASDAFYKPKGSLRAIAEQIKASRLDILIFPELGMDPRTFALAILRLAPVQCAGWGHPMTSGLPNVDYFISVRAMEPPDAESHYSEQLVLLDGIGTCYSKQTMPANLKPRSAFGLPDDKTLYLFPQSLFKLHPDNDALLAEILHQDERGILVLFRNQSAEVTEAILARLSLALQGRNMALQDRVIVLPFMRHEDFLNINVLCDLMLDSLDWSGGNTSLDAIACGLPVVTLPGRYMRGRQTLAMLNLAGVPELVADDAETYIAIAVRLGRDAEWRHSIREKLNAGSGNVFDQAAPIGNLNAFLSATSRLSRR